MEVLGERTEKNGFKSALTLVHCNNIYKVKIGTDPVLKFRWNTDEERWIFIPQKHYAGVDEYLEADEIIVRIPVPDPGKLFGPWIRDINDESISSKVEDAMEFVATLKPPKSANEYKERMEAWKKENGLSILSDMEGEQ